MTTQPRLHLVPGIKVDETFEILFQESSLLAATAVETNYLTSGEAWALAQYIDLADAGYGARTTTLYRRALFRLSAYVSAHLGEPKLRGMFGHSAILFQLVDKVLDGEILEADSDAAGAYAREDDAA